MSEERNVYGFPSLEPSGPLVRFPAGTSLIDLARALESLPVQPLVLDSRPELDGDQLVWQAVPKRVTL